MFVWSFKMNKRELLIALSGVLLFIVLAVVLLRSGGTDTERNRAERCAATPQQRVDFLSSYGWEVEPIPLAVKEITLPDTPDTEFAEYELLQKSQGYDLEKLHGKKVKLWTYRVTNYPIENESMVANILVKDGYVVGGDISRATTGGAVQGFDPNKFGNVAAKLQMSLAASAVDRSVPDVIPADSEVLPEPDSDGEW